MKLGISIYPGLDTDRGKNLLLLQNAADKIGSMSLMTPLWDGPLMLHAGNIWVSQILLSGVSISRTSKSQFSFHKKKAHVLLYSKACLKISV